MLKRQRLQQAWVCLSCLSEVEANILNGFEYSEVSLFGTMAFQAWGKISSGKVQS